jgi:chemotaxis protein methyltransferase CheR
MIEAEIEELEIRLFFEAMAMRHGYDFRHYAKASMKRRLLSFAQSLGCREIGTLIPRLLREEDFLAQALAHLSVPVTEMFRDPSVFLALRRDVLPLLDSYPRITIWQPGCATGEEPYSLAIMLKEEGLLHKVQIYATDINDEALAKAEEGIYPARNLAAYARNYEQAGGKGSLTDYFHTAYNFSKINEDIREKIVFAHHNLVVDGVFCEVNLVICRNVLIYFDRTLQNRVLSLFHECLVRGGYLCLGNRESLRFTDVSDRFRNIDKIHRIFRKQEMGS